MSIPMYLKDTTKVIGYFSYTASESVFCDGDACIIAGTEGKIKNYHAKMKNDDNNEKDIIRKTRFGEIIDGMRQGGAYAFDEEAYARFYDTAAKNGIDGLPGKEFFLEYAEEDLNFARIQFVEL